MHNPWNQHASSMESTSIHLINKHQVWYSIIDNIASLIATFKRYALVFEMYISNFQVDFCVQDWGEPQTLVTSPVRLHCTMCINTLIWLAVITCAGLPLVSWTSAPLATYFVVEVFHPHSDMSAHCCLPSNCGNTKLVLVLVGQSQVNITFNHVIMF